MGHRGSVAFGPQSNRGDGRFSSLSASEPALAASLPIKEGHSVAARDPSAGAGDTQTELSHTAPVPAPNGLGSDEWGTIG